MPDTDRDEAEARRQRIAARIAVVAFLVGIVLRYEYIFNWHPMLRFIYSDMNAYMSLIDKILDPQSVHDISETVYPPGTPLFFAWMKLLDPSMDLAMTVQFLQSLAVPILLGLLGARLFSVRTGYYATAAASLYFPLFDFFGYLMSEGPFTFFLLVAAWLFVAGIQSRGARKIIYGLLLGLVLGFDASLKSIALPVAAVTLVPLLYFTWKYQLKVKGFVAAGIAGLVLVLVPMSIRATRLNEGRFCLLGNELSRNVLLGHYGDVLTIRFIDGRRNFWHEFSNNANVQHGYTAVKTLDCGVYENGPIFQAAFDWSLNHPVKTVALSLEHICETFFTTETWPSYFVLELRHWVVFFHFVFIVGIFLPAGCYLLTRWREIVRLQRTAAAEIFLCAPLLALVISVFISTGEARYRVPFDGFMLLLAMRYLTRHGAPAPDLLAAAAPGAPAAAVTTPVAPAPAVPVSV